MKTHQAVQTQMAEAAHPLAPYPSIRPEASMESVSEPSHAPAPLASCCKAKFALRNEPRDCVEETADKVDCREMERPDIVEMSRGKKHAKTPSESWGRCVRKSAGAMNSSESLQ